MQKNNPQTPSVFIDRMLDETPVGKYAVISCVPRLDLNDDTDRKRFRSLLNKIARRKGCQCFSKWDTRHKQMVIYRVVEYVRAE